MHRRCAAQMVQQYKWTGRYGTLDVASGLGGLSEKGIQDLRRDLAAVEAEMASELQAGVHAQYPCFIAASQVCPGTCAGTAPLTWKQLAQVPARDDSLAAVERRSRGHTVWPFPGCSRCVDSCCGRQVCADEPWSMTAAQRMRLPSAGPGVCSSHQRTGMLWPHHCSNTVSAGGGEAGGADAAAARHPGQQCSPGGQPEADCSCKPGWARGLWWCFPPQAPPGVDGVP